MPTILNRFSKVYQLDVHPVAGDAFEIILLLDPGLYQLSAVADGSQFDWARLYRDEAGSDGSPPRTGPRDFPFNQTNRIC